MKQRIRHIVVAIILAIALIVPQFTIDGGSIDAAPTCNCNCRDLNPTGVSYCFGTPVNCRDYCKGKVTIIDYTGGFLSEAWEWYQITGY